MSNLDDVKASECEACNIHSEKLTQIIHIGRHSAQNVSMCGILSLKMKMMA